MKEQDSRWSAAMPGALILCLAGAAVAAQAPVPLGSVSEALRRARASSEEVPLPKEVGAVAQAGAPAEPREVLGLHHLPVGTRFVLTRDFHIPAHTNSAYAGGADAGWGLEVNGCYLYWRLSEHRRVIPAGAFLSVTGVSHERSSRIVHLEGDMHLGGQISPFTGPFGDIHSTTVFSGETFLKLTCHTFEGSSKYLMNVEETLGMKIQLPPAVVSKP